MSEQGVPASVLVGEDHMQVRAPLVALVKSANAALVWTRIEYRARHVAFAHEHGGRMWWEVKAADLAREVGLSVPQTERALVKLVQGGFLLAEQHSLPLQTMSYSAVIAQSAESRIGDRDSAVSSPRNRGVQSANSLIPPIYEEREGEKNKVAKPATLGQRFAQPLCDVLAAELDANGVKYSVTQRWLDAARLMVDRDGRDPHQAKALIEWACRDSFWAANIQSMPTFREQFDKLRMHRDRAVGGAKRSTVEHGRDVDALLAAEEAQQLAVTA